MNDSPSSAGPSDDGEVLRSRVAEARTQFERARDEYEQAIADADVIQEDRDSARQLLEEATAWLRAAEQALTRYETGDYGRCQRCGEPIGAERLEAIPDATSCRSCSR